MFRLIKTQLYAFNKSILTYSLNIKDIRNNIKTASNHQTACCWIFILNFITRTLFRDYHLYYFISILRRFCTVLRLFFAVLFSLSSLVLQNMLQLSFLNSSLRFAGHIFPNKKPNISLSFFLSIRYIQSVY